VRRFLSGLYPTVDGDAVPRSGYPSGPMKTLGEDLDAFYLEQRRCGELDGGANGEWIWMACSCGAMIARPLNIPAETS